MFKEQKNLVDFIQQRNALALLLALHHLSNPHWNTVEDYCLNELGLESFSWQSYDKMCKQLVRMGLAIRVKIRTNAQDYRLNDYGHQVVITIEEALDKINAFSSVLKNHTSHGS